MQGVKFLAASIATSLPVKVDPVKQIISTGNLVKAFATYTFPYITLKYCGSMYLSKSFFKTLEFSGANSLGLRMTQFPAEIAAAT